MTARVIGIDPGLANTGVAELVHDGHRVTSLTTRVETSNPPATPTDDQTAARMTRMIRAVAPTGSSSTCDSCGWATNRAPDDLVMVIMEGPAFHAKDRNAHAGSGYWWRLRSLLTTRGIPVAKCNPVHLKTWAADSGRASDAQLKLALDRMWPGVLARTDHEVDAALLALAAGQFLRWHDLGEPLRQAQHLAKMSWPKLPERVGAGR